MTTKNKSVRSKTEEMVLGKNKYIVTTHYKGNGRETAEEKLFRYVSNRISRELKTSKNAVI